MKWFSLYSLWAYLVGIAEVWGLIILSGGPPAFANNSPISGLAFFSTKHFVISERVLFHFGTKPEISKFSREERLDSRVAKEVVLVSVQFHGGFSIALGFAFSKLFVSCKKKYVSTKSLCFKIKNILTTQKRML